MNFMENQREPLDAHVQQASKLFRDCGFTLAALAYPRPPEALAALRDFNRVPEHWQHPFAWNYHPNEWCAREWFSPHPDILAEIARLSPQHKKEEADAE